MKLTIIVSNVMFRLPVLVLVLALLVVTTRLDIVVTLSVWTDELNERRGRTARKRNDFADVGW